MQRIIREEEPPKPSTRLTTLGEESTVVSQNRGTDPKKLGQLVRGDLDWIVMKALDKERNRRYETANGFAADIERFLADEPVNACPPSAAYRFRKFARRNKAPMVVAAVAAVALVVVAIGSTIAAGRFRALAKRNADLVVIANESEADAVEAQKEAEDARDKEEELRIEAQRQTKIATDALADAQAQRERAEENFALARSAVDEFLNEVTENELLTVPGMQRLRQELLSSAMEFYDDFTQDEANASELLVELASAHYRISVIRGELGKKEESQAANARSIELFEQLLEGGNESLEVRLGLARAYFRGERYDDTVKLCEQIRQDDPEDADTRSLLAGTYNTLANSKKEIRHSLALHRQALKLREGLVQEFPDNAGYLAQLSSTVNNLGVLQAHLGQHRESLAMFERAVSYSAEAYDKSPQTILWGRWLCIGLHNIAAKRAYFGDQAEALLAYQRAVAVYRKLAFDNPAVPSLKGKLYKAWIDLGSYQQDLGKSSDAARSFRAAEHVLANIDANTPSELFDLAIVYGALATPAEGTVDGPTEAEQELQREYAGKAMETLDRAVREGYRDVDALRTREYLAVLRERNDFQELLVWLDAEVLTSNEAGATEEALTERRESLAALRKLIGHEPTDVRHTETLAAILHSVALIEAGLENYDAAEEALAEELAIRERLQQDDPANAQYGVDLGAVSIALGDVCWKSSRFPKAREHWETGLELLEAARLLSPGDDEVQAKIAAQERTVYRRYGELGLWERAAQYALRSLELERTTDDTWDSRMSIPLLAIGETEAHRAYTELLFKAWCGTKTSRNIRTLWVVCMNPDPAVSSEDLLSQLKLQAFDEYDTATVYYRAGQFEKARELQDPLVESNPAFTHALFWSAMTLQKLNEPELAEERLDQGQVAYQQYALKCLNGSTVGDALDGLWFHLAQAQLLRRQAWNEVRGHEPPVDPWQHLIQARAYQTIGETELAEAELAAAEAAAAGNDEALLAHQRLVEQWDEIARGVLEQKLAGDLADVDLIRGLVDNDQPDVRHRNTLATTLHSIGQIQIGLKQFEDAEQSLNQALEIRQELHSESLDDPQLYIDVLSVQDSIGRWHWTQGDFVGAHEQWKQCTKAMDDVSKAHADDPDVQSRLLAEQRGIIMHYGSIGLWEFVTEYERRCLEIGKLNAGYGYGEFTAVLLAHGDNELAQQYFLKFSEHLPTRNSEWSRVINLVRGLSTVDRVDLISKELENRAQRILTENPTNTWVAVAVAVMHYRRGEYQEAFSILEHAKNRVWPQSTFLESAVAFKAGDEERAHSRFSAAEQRYRAICREALQRSVGKEDTGVFNEHWWQFAYGQVTRRLAREAMSLRASPEDDPWQHLLQARGYRLIGETELSDAELQAAAAAAPDDLDVHLVRIQLLEEWGQTDGIEDEWQKVVEAAAGDPMPWIERGRWYAQRGEHEKAEADFAQAASLTPNELNKFLEAGWWVVGPYPANLAEFCPPELDPDPSKPVYTIDPKTGLSDEPVSWASVATGGMGLVDLSSAPGRQDGGSVYATAQVYSPDERSVILMIHRDQALRVWVNGELIRDFVPGEYAVQPEDDVYARVPFVLRTGLNTLLIKTATPNFTVRIGDSPRDRAVFLAEQRRLSEAAALLDGFSYVRGALPWWVPLVPAVASQNAAMYESQCQDIYQTLETGNTIQWAYQCSQRENETFRTHAEEFLAAVEDVLNSDSPPWLKNWAAVVCYRAGDDERARSLIVESYPGGHALQALLDHRAGETASAEESLAAALRWGAQYRENLQNGDRSDFWQQNTWPRHWVPSFLLLAEAEQKIRGETTASDELRLAVEETMRGKWTADPQLAAFDQTVYWASYSENPHPYLARGRRLAELGRFEQAEADFDKAIDLAGKDDSWPWLRRAQFRIESGDLTGAGQDFRVAHVAAEKQGWFTHAAYVEGLMRPHEDVLEEFGRLHPAAAWRMRGEWAAMHGDWETAADCHLSHDRFWSHLVSLAAIRCIQMDDAGYADACNRLSAINDTESLAPHERAYREALALGISPRPVGGAEGLVTLARTAYDDSPDNWDSRFVLGIALYRDGRFDEVQSILVAVPHWNRSWAVHYDAIRSAVLAMTHFRLNNTDESHRWLNRCDVWLDSFHRRRELVAAGHPEVLRDDGSYVWFVAFALVREAKALIDGEEADFSTLATADAPRERSVLQLYGDAKRHVAAGENEQAVALLSEAIARAPRSHELLAMRAETYKAQKQWELADADYTQAIELRPDMKSFRARGNLRRNRLRDFEGTLANYNEAIRLYPDDQDAVYGRGRTYLDMGRYEEAIPDFTKAIELGRRATMPYSRRAWAYLQLGDYEKALADAETLIQMKPESGLGYSARASVYVAQEDWDQARAEVEKLFELQPPSRRWYPRAAVYLAAGDLEAYQELCRTALEVDGQTDDPEVAGHIAWVCSFAPHALDDPAALLTLAEKFLETDPNGAGKIYVLATSLYRCGRYDEALARLNEAVELRGEGACVWDWLFLAMTHHQLGHAEEAGKWYEQAAALLDDTESPPDPWNHWWTERTYLKYLRGEAEALMGIESEQAEEKRQQPVVADPSTGS